MRIGQNPAKFIHEVDQPARVTIAIVNYIPFISGYYEQSLDVLKACLGSIWENTDQPYDLLVWDNASCPEVRTYLAEAQAQGQIQFLMLSNKNIGKGGAWNFIFSAAPGEFIAYADADVYFLPGWLSAHLEAFEIFPRLGMITGAPLRTPAEYFTSTVEWAESTPDATLERGHLISWQDIWKHTRSLGLAEEKARQLYEEQEDLRLTYQGHRYYPGGAHYQFMARSEVLRSTLPIPSDKPMRKERMLDIRINEQGYLRLCTESWWAYHLGNTLEGSSAGTGEAARIQQVPPRLRSNSYLRRMIQKLYHWTFHWLYHHQRHP
jgi:glycosyltransferase involved in cell wall biosynthesis